MATTVYFLDWLKAEVLTPEALARAENLFARLEVVASPLSRLKSTPQTPPYHAEGAHVSDHVIRIFAGLEALEQGASLTSIEDFVREKDQRLDFAALESTLKNNLPFFYAYAACHDLAKADVYVLDKNTSEVHYPDHARRSASDEYASTREAVLQALNVPAAQARVLTELIRCHLDVIHGFNHGPDPIRYAALGAIAERAGLNKPVFLDLLPGAIFLDAILGSLVYINGNYTVDLQILLNLFKSEREAVPERHAARVEAVRRGRKTALREALQAAEIDADTVFDLLKTPYGPVRGQVMAQVHELIRDPESKVDLGEHTAELKRRAMVASKLLSERDLTLE